jgi:hypothetical protein
MGHVLGGHLRRFTFAAGIPSGAKARGFIAQFDVRAEARTLQNSDRFKSPAEPTRSIDMVITYAAINSSLKLAFSNLPIAKRPWLRDRKVPAQHIIVLRPATGPIFPAKRETPWHESFTPHDLRAKTASQK